MSDDKAFHPIFSAVEHGDLPQVCAYLDQGGDIEIRGKWGVTPLILAVFGGFIELTALLIARGADINARYNAGNTPLIVAAWLGHREIARLLLKHGADSTVTNLGGADALAWAAEHGHMEIVELLLSAGADTLNPALCFACEHGHTAIARFLVEQGANPDYPFGAHRMTPLVAAAYTGHIDTMQYLLAAGANKHAADDAALGWACGFQQLAVAELLLAHGANVNGHGLEGLSFLQEAIAEGRDAVIALLRKYRA